MTNIITRYFENTEQAHNAVFELIERQGASPRIIDMHTSAEGLADALTAQHVDAAAAQAYEAAVGNGGAVVLVRAGFRPLGVAQITRDVMARMGAADAGDLVEEVIVKDDVSLLSVMQGAPHMMTRPLGYMSSNRHMANWPIKLISRRKPIIQTTIDHRAWAKWPIDHLIPRHKFQAEAFGHLLPHNLRFGRFPIDLLVPGHKFMAKFPFGHLVGHKTRYGRFPIGLLVPGHKFMANFPIRHLAPRNVRFGRLPFPLLINGKQGSNALVPGHKSMAKFPFAHLVPGHKFMAKFPFAHLVPGHKHMAKFPFAHIVPGHKHMAKFPFGHLVPGHKFMAKFPFAHLVPGHKFMANFIFPHTKSA